MEWIDVKKEWPPWNAFLVFEDTFGNERFGSCDYYNMGHQEAGYLYAVVDSQRPPPKGGGLEGNN